MGSVIGFAGLSHLGVVSSVATAARGFDVVAYDRNLDLVDAVRNGQLPVHEPGLAELFQANAGRLTFTAAPQALGACAVVVLAQDVPTSADNQSDHAAVDVLAEEVIGHLAPSTVLVILSQVGPGYTRALGWRLGSDLRARDVSLFYQVETLIFGQAVDRALHPERFIVGCDNPHRLLPAAYRGLLAAFDCPILPMRYESAELAKIAINIFLAASVTATNTLAEVCEKIGADWGEIIPALQLDKRIGPHAYLRPGLGLAGGNLERDLATVRDLAAEIGSDARIIDAYLASSIYRRDWVIRTLHGRLSTSGAKPVLAVWGLAYKPNTHSTRNSPSLGLIQALSGVAVEAYDPHASLPTLDRADCRQRATPLEACDGADALVVMTPWPMFAEVDLALVLQAMRGRLLVDPFGRLDRGRAADLGFSYHRLGDKAQEGIVAA
jgi:UDPglucose 6-dehydrogenase